jgi:hypothetical protein
MGKGSSGKKPNMAAKRNRARYKAEGRCEANKKRKAEKQRKLNEKLAKKDKGPLIKKVDSEEYQHA